MTITMGDLVSELFDSYDRALRDPKLAAVATQVRLTELLRTPRVRARRCR
jgi:hypothetical protein